VELAREVRTEVDGVDRQARSAHLLAPTNYKKKPLSPEGERLFIVCRDAERFRYVRAGFDSVDATSAAPIFSPWSLSTLRIFHH
jgi:hypothetical protein